VGYGLYTGETLTSLLDQNRTLLEEVISRTEIEKSIHFLKTRKHIRFLFSHFPLPCETLFESSPSSFLNFLAALCSDGKKAVTKNQEAICEELFKEESMQV